MKAKFLLAVSIALLLFSNWAYSEGVVTGEVAVSSSGTTEIIQPVVSTGRTSQPILDQKLERRSGLETFQKFIVLMPFVLGMLIIMLILGNLNKANYRLSDALSESQPVPTTTTANGQDGSSSTTITNSVTQVKSSSRLVMFISSMITVVIAICLVSFYIYQVFATGNGPDLGSVTTMLLTLGVGVVPYAFNKISS